MANNKLIIVTGLCATGKTTIARKVAEEVQLPLFCRDDFKEILFDTLGWEGREWSKKLGGASYDLLYYAMESVMRAGVSSVVESNFQSEFAKEKIRGFIEKYKCDVITINCVTDAAVRAQRFKDRNEKGERHPGHVDHVNYDQQFIDTPEDALLDLGGTLITVDTTDFDTINYEDLIKKLR